MVRPLALVPADDLPAVIDGVRRALTGEGPAVMPVAEAAHPAPPATVEDRVALVVETSGSTAHPKRVALAAEAVVASVHAAHERLGAPGQWLLAVPAHYIAGINVITRGLAGDGVVAMDDLGHHFRVSSFLSTAARMTADHRYVSLVPTQLRRLLSAEETLESLRRFDRILVGGQRLPDDLRALALEAGLNVTVTYGSSETCGGCVWDGIPLDGTHLEIVDGRVEIAAPSLALGYLDEAERTAAAFTERGGRRWYRTDDLGAITEGVLSISGRADDVIISGGVKVSLAEVETCVRTVPGLAEAVVVAAPHPEWGEVPVVVSTVAVDLLDLRHTVAARLGAAAAPALVRVVEEIPLLPSGKPDRRALAAGAP